MSIETLADRAASHARAYLAGVGDRPVGATLTPDELRALLGGPLDAEGQDPARVIDALAEAAHRGTVASQGPRYFGFVTGGACPPPSPPTGWSRPGIRTPRCS